jgi:hypothetical protein
MSEFVGINIDSPWGDRLINPVGMTLHSVSASGEEITLVFEDGTITLKPEGYCCAHAYLTDLNVASDLPAVVLGWSDSPTTTEDKPYGEVQDTSFVKIRTSKGYVDFTLHTDHNGYYGGRYYAVVTPS